MIETTKRIPYLPNSIYLDGDSRHPGHLNYPKSVLRYPGGKSRAIDQMSLLIPNDCSRILSPFAGACHVEIAVAHFSQRFDIPVLAFDNDHPLVNFWKFALSNPKSLADKVQKEFFPIGKELFDKFKNQIHSMSEDTLEKAAIFFALNRSSFDGTTGMSGGYAQKELRFTQSSIDSLRKFFSPNLTVNLQDFQDTIQSAGKDDFLFCDPPYMTKYFYYGKKGGTHKDFDHIALRDLLSQKDNWILCYNNVEIIRDMYKEYEIIEPTWSYGMGLNKSSKEILVFSPQISNRIQWSVFYENSSKSMKFKQSSLL